MPTNRSRPKTPGLSLAVLSLLSECPKHPYEIQTDIRQRGHEMVIKLRIGSVYDTVERLVQLGLVRVVETIREGRRPERTVYEITDAGREELHRWILELVERPVQEYPAFAAALAFIGHLGREGSIAALDRRLTALEAEIEVADHVIHQLVGAVLPRLAIVEGEFMLAMKRAEAEHVRRLAAELREGTLPWPTAEDWARAGAAAEGLADRVGDELGMPFKTPPAKRARRSAPRPPIRRNEP